MIDLERHNFAGPSKIKTFYKVILGSKLIIAGSTSYNLETIRKISKNSREDTRLFWLNYEKEWPELAAYTKAILTVPASSGAVERVFSVGGSILRPSRRRLSDKLFEMLMFLKCNWHLFKNDMKL